MKYCVNVPLERELHFPNRCPFSDRPSPSGTVRLKQTSTSRVLPHPGGFWNSYATTALRIPAGRMIAVLALGFQIMMWLSILGGMAIAALLATADNPQTRFAALFVAAGLLAAVGFRVARWILLRRVSIGNAWHGFVKVRFGSESYAREFSELNRLPLVSD